MLIKSFRFFLRTMSFVVLPLETRHWTKNMMRHALLADVTVQAVNRVTFPHGYGGLIIEDAMTAHRIGQLPICGSTPCTFVIKKTAPDDAPLTWVTSDDIVEDDETEGSCVYRPAGSRFLIAPLLAGQRFHAVATTAAGSGRKHTLWSSVFLSIHKRDDGKDAFCIQTTGAINPKDAWTSALYTTMSVFQAIVDAIDIAKSQTL